MAMLSLMVPGVGMGGSEVDVVPGGGGRRFLLMMKVGRILIPFVILTKALYEFILSLGGK